MAFFKIHFWKIVCYDQDKSWNLSEGGQSLGYILAPSASEVKAMITDEQSLGNITCIHTGREDT